MILGYEEIVRRIEEERLLENAEQENIQGAGVDLRLKTAYHPMSGGKLLVNERKTPDIEEVPGGKIIVEPNEYLLVETMEKVNMPKDLVARVLPRSSLFRCGASLRHALVDPAYRGALIFGLKNESKYNFVVEKGSRIAQIVFETVQGGTREYGGRYQGGNVV